MSAFKERLNMCYPYVMVSNRSQHKVQQKWMAMSFIFQVVMHESIRKYINNALFLYSGLAAAQSEGT